MASTVHDSNDRNSSTSDVALLEMLARRFGTDKLKHGYIPSYVKHMAHLRVEPLVLVEIGLKKKKPGYAGCESLKMWREYFPAARIVGLDIIDVSTLPRVANTEVYQCDCTDAQAIEQILSRHDIAPDLVIDDGAHTPKSHQIALGTIFPRMRPGGTYFIEDLQVCINRDMFKRWEVNDANNTVTYLKDLQGGRAPQSLFLDRDRNADLQAAIDAIHFETDMKLAVIKKRA
jgi:demethylmacrocin O-methyltransferase